LRNVDSLIVAGPSSLELAGKIASHLSSEIITVNTQIFSDGEFKIKMPNVKGKYCAVVQSLYPPTDRHLVQALMIMKKCRDDNADFICNLSPYMAYARQDRAFLEDEFPSMSLIAKLFESVGANRMVTLDIHSLMALSYFSIEVENISSIPLFADYVKRNMHLHEPLAVSPDLGGKERIEEFSKILGVDYLVLEKSRDRYSGEVFINSKEIPDIVAGRDIIILDDIISTGSSIVKATEILRRKSSGKIYVMCSHSLINENNIRNILDAGVEDIIATNSIPSRFAKIDISPALASCIRKGI
jgi:ribose-phosphate pyrophosphokinase